MIPLTTVRKVTQDNSLSMSLEDQPGRVQTSAGEHTSLTTFGGRATDSDDDDDDSYIQPVDLETLIEEVEGSGESMEESHLVQRTTNAPPTTTPIATQPPKIKSEIRTTEMATVKVPVSILSNYIPRKDRNIRRRHRKKYKNIRHGRKRKRRRRKRKRKGKAQLSMHTRRHHRVRKDLSEQMSSVGVTKTQVGMGIEDEVLQVCCHYHVFKYWILYILREICVISRYSVTPVVRHIIWNKTLKHELPAELTFPKT